MSENEITKHEPKPLDSFRYYDDTIDGDDDEHGGGGAVIVGTRLKFTNEARWEDPEGTDYTGRELIAVDVVRVETKWGDGHPVAERILGPGDKFRDLKKLNAEAPKEEWRMNKMTGQLEGPWQHQRVLHFLEVETMQKFSWPTKTTGGRICIDALVEHVNDLRKFRGPDLFVRVQLTSKHMKTQWGGRLRPHLEFKGCVRPSSAGSLETVDMKALPVGTPVSEPTLKELTEDKVPF